MKADWLEFSPGKDYRWGLFPFFNIFPFTLIYQKTWGYCGAGSNGADKNEKEAKMPISHNFMILLGAWDRNRTGTVLSTEGF